MTQQQNPTAVRKRSDNRETLARFSLPHLRPRLPLRFPLDPNLPPSPKRRYRSHYRYLDAEGLEAPQVLETLSPFDVALRLIDYAHLEPLLAAHIYTPSAKGQVPFHPVSMYLLLAYRRAQDLSRAETLRVLKSKEGAELRRRLGFEDQFPTESGLRYFEKQIKPELQWEINALQVEMVYRACLLPRTALLIAQLVSSRPVPLSLPPFACSPPSPVAGSILPLRKPYVCCRLTEGVRSTILNLHPSQPGGHEPLAGAALAARGEWFEESPDSTEHGAG